MGIGKALASRRGQIERLKLALQKIAASEVRPHRAGRNLVDRADVDALQRIARIALEREKEA